MLYYQTTKAPKGAEASLHAIFNADVRELGVVCIGSKDGVLYFKEVVPHANENVLLGEIMQRLNDNDEVRTWAQRERITRVAIQ
jgi:hypothetical protein